MFNPLATKVRDGSTQSYTFLVVAGLWQGYLLFADDVVLLASLAGDLEGTNLDPKSRSFNDVCL